MSAPACPQCGRDALSGQYLVDASEARGEYDGYLCDGCGGWWTAAEFEALTGYTQEDDEPEPVPAPRANASPERRAARVWFEVHTGGSRRQRRALVALWTRPGRAAEMLAHAARCRELAGAQGRGLRTSAGASAWAVQSLRDGRARYLVDARDTLYHMRLARRAGVLRVRVPA